MNKPVLLSVAAVLATGVGAALLWRAGTDQVLVAKQDDSPIVVGPSQATTAAESESAIPSGQSTSPLGEQDLQAILRKSREFLLRDDPASLAQYKETLEREYQRIGKALALTPEEVSRIIETLIRLKQESDAALRELASRDPADLGLELRQLARQREDIEMMALLGSKYTQWQEANLAPITLASVNNLQTLMEMSDVRPLTSEQVDALATALNAERVRILRDTSADQKISPGTNTATGMYRQGIEWEQRHTPESNRRLEVIASRLLDPQQLAIYRRMLDDDYNKRLEAIRGSLASQEALDRRLRSLP